jgi:hypothetical protein
VALSTQEIEERIKNLGILPSLSSMANLSSCHHEMSSQLSTLSGLLLKEGSSSSSKVQSGPLSILFVLLFAIHLIAIIPQRKSLNEGDELLSVFQLPVELKKSEESSRDEESSNNLDTRICIRAYRLILVSKNYPYPIAIYIAQFPTFTYLLSTKTKTR